MEFERLTRRDLQGLCKKNKIPANITNVAMIDALKALDIIEGIEELMQSCQSETAQSSIESPGKMEITSPYVPPTGGRTTRRKNVAKEEPETVQPLTRTRRSTRKTIAKDADESKADGTETPALVQTTRRRAPAASVCRKMEAELKECVEEEKKISATPAPSGVASRRRRAVKEETVMKKVYSTRRSVRLADKSEEKLHEVESGESDTFKMDLFNKDGDENVQMNSKDGLDGMDETSQITGVDANINVENTEGKDESEVNSAQEQHAAVVEAMAQVTVDEEMANNFEADDQKPEEVVSDLNSEKTKLDEEKCDETEVSNGENLVMPLDVSSEVQKANGSHDVYASEIDIAVENNAVLEIEDKHEVDFPCESEIEKELNNNNDMDSEYVPEEVLEISADPHVAVEEKELINDGADDMPSDVSLLNEEEEAKIEPTPFSSAPLHPTGDFPIKSSASKASATKNRMLSVVSDNKENVGSGTKVVPTKERVMIKKSTSGLDDLSVRQLTKMLKENVGSGTKVVPTKERVMIKKSTSGLDDLSVRQLTKMLKEKLEITKKALKNENENEYEQAPVRLALQALPENSAVGGTLN